MKDLRSHGDEQVARCPFSFDDGVVNVWGNKLARQVAEDPHT